MGLSWLGQRMTVVIASFKKSKKRGFIDLTIEKIKEINLPLKLQGQCKR